MKSRKTKEEPSIEVLLQRRSSLLFWIERLTSRPPSAERLIDATKDTILYAVEKLGFQRINAGSDVPYFGRADIIDLVDFDSKNSKFSDLAQQHHLAWTIA
jgi:hypothetical protein